MHWRFFRIKGVEVSSPKCARVVWKTDSRMFLNFAKFPFFFFLTCAMSHVDGWEHWLRADEPLTLHRVVF